MTKYQRTRKRLLYYDQRKAFHLANGEPEQGAQNLAFEEARNMTDRQLEQWYSSQPAKASTSA